jgi:hypothetical protein
MMKNFPLQINFRADALTLRRLRELCARSRASQGALLRHLIEQAWLAAFSPGCAHDSRL